MESPATDAIAALWQLMDKYEDLPMDFCDASLMVLASSLKNQPHRHHRRERFFSLSFAR
jgi:predicted nucleic acid-binding protein